MNERLKFIRKNAKLTQTEFAESIGLAKSTWSKIELNYAIATDRTIKDICRVYRVNETWLRTGEGEPFANRSRNQEIADFINDVMESNSSADDDFRKRLIFALSRLDSKDWEVLSDIAEKIKSAE